MHSGDAVLLERWREERDAQAFAELAARYAGLVYSACRRILGNDSDAEDVVQDCFLSLAQKAPKKRQPLGPWLYVVATNSALNRRKSQVRRVAREHRYAEETVRGAEADWDDVQQYVDEAVAALPDKLRQPIVLHFFEGRSQAAVAEAMGLPRTTVSGRIARGIEETREQLKRRGISVGAVALAAMLSAETGTAAPAGLTAALGKLALAGTRGAAGGAAVVAAGGIALKLAGVGGVLFILAAAVFVVNLRAETGVGAVTPVAVPAVAADEATAAVAGSAPAEDSSSAPLDDGDVLAAGGALVGSVVDDNGGPVAGAEVVVGVGDEKTAGVQTDASGGFCFESLPAGPFVLHAFKSAVGLASLEDVPSQGDLGDLTLEPLGRVSGRVYDKASGEGIPHLTFQLVQFQIDNDLLNSARVMLESFQEGHRYGQSDGAGMYEIVDLLAAKYGYWPEEKKDGEYVFPGMRDMPKEIVVRRGETLMGVDLALERGGSISGTVLNDRGVALEKAWVELVPAKHSFFGFEGVTTGADGAYEFRGLPTGGTYKVAASHKDYALQTSEPVALTDARAVSGIDFRLTSGYKLEGTLLDDTGSPVAAADVHFSDHGGSRTSDSNGRFSFAHVAPGNYKLWVRKDEVSFESPYLSFTMPAGDLLDLVITLSRSTPGVIRGRVVTSAGEPLHDVRVNAFSDTRTPSGKSASAETVTDEDGRFEFTELGDANTCAVDAYPGNYTFVRQHHVPVGTTDLELVVQRFGTVSGRVVDAGSGEPVTEYRILHVQFGPGTWGGESEYDRDWFPVQSEDGAFQLGDVAPPATRIEVSAKGYAPGQTERLELAEGGSIEDVVLKLNRGASLAGRIIDERTGAAVPGARVRAYSPTYFNSMLLRESDNLGVLNLKTCISTMAGGDGRFVLDPFTPGEKVGVVAWHDGYATQILPLVVVGKGAVPLDIRLAPEGRLVVRVENAHVIDAPVLTWCRQVDGAYQGDSGTEWRGLPAGQYEVVIQTPDSRQLGVLSAEVAAGETTEVVADLATAGAAFGSVYGVIELGWASVHVSPAGSERTMYAYGYTDESGMFRIGGLPPGEYDVKAYRFSDEQDYEGQARVLVEAGQEREVQIEMQPAVHPALR
ncbi:MAG TPA: sigma-70 family RNA polymerase sigma factor [Candidatus Bathyarchaeia archaeon]|nr:sigma-70 family RNA polymerase sigma factor [Candidatus Bathyarchaeia archaeon]